MNDRPMNDRWGIESATKTSSNRKVNRQPTLVAIDLGAESCRVSLLQWADGKPVIRMVHRFPNAPVPDGDSLRWDLQRICDGVDEGLRKCAELAPDGIAAIGVDGWAVDYVRLDANSLPTGDPFCYRDRRTIKAQAEVHARISPDRLYTLTGIQILSLNTLYQLFSDSAAGVDQSLPWINLPEYILYRLGGKRVSEYTNATHTQLIDVNNRTWCTEIFDAAGLDINAAPPLVAPGTEIGRITGPLASLPALRYTKLIAAVCHDTASAIAGIPADGDDWAFISSGTWSLVGTVLDAAQVSDAARSKNFSNEGGVGSKTYFLKNVSGMWLLQQCIEQWRSQGREWTIEQLVEECSSLPRPECLFDVSDPDLLSPGDMPARINAQLARDGRVRVAEDPETAPAFASLILYSLAKRYAEVLQDLAEVTGKALKRLFIVGGGSRNKLLNRLTAESTGLEVFTGSNESATVGNFAIQLAALSEKCGPENGVDASAVARYAKLFTQEELKTATAHLDTETAALFK
jgi:rhamnulokinase